MENKHNDSTFVLHCTYIDLRYILSIQVCASQKPKIRSKQTVCQRSSDPLYIVTYYIKWVTTSWTDGIFYIPSAVEQMEKNCSNSLKSYD